MNVQRLAAGRRSHDGRPTGGEPFWSDRESARRTVAPTGTLIGHVPLTSAELAECQCPDLCARDHHVD